MPYSYQDGRFHFLFAEPDDLYFTKSLVRRSSEEMITLSLRKAGYGRILYSQEVQYRRLRLSASVPKTAVEAESRDVRFFGKFFDKEASLLSVLDAGQEKIVTEEEFRKLVIHILAGEREGRTAFVMPVRLFYCIYENDEAVSGLKAALQERAGTYTGFSASKGSIFLLTASRDVNESLPFLMDEEGIFRSEFFPEMEYILNGSLTEPFYYRLQRMFRNRVVGLDPLSQKQISRLLERRALEKVGGWKDPDGLLEDAEHLYILLHSPRWRRELQASARETGVRLTLLSVPNKLRKLDEILNRPDTEKILDFSKVTFKKKYGELRLEKVFREKNRGVFFELPCLQRGSSMEFGILKERMEEVLEDGGGRKQTEDLERLENIENWLYVAWERSTSVETSKVGGIPESIQQCLRQCVGWVQQYSETEAGDISSVLDYLEKLIIKKRGMPVDSEEWEAYCRQIREEYPKLIEIELGVADLKKRIRLLQTEEADDLRAITQTAEALGRKEKALTEAAGGNRNFLAELVNKQFLTCQEREYLELKREFARRQMAQQGKRDVRQKLETQMDLQNQMREQLRLMMKLIGAGGRQNEAKGARQLLAELQDRLEEQVRAADEQAGIVSQDKLKRLVEGLRQQSEQ